MTLIKSISGIRGTIGGEPGKGLSPLDIVKFVSAYTMFIRQSVGKERIKVVVGRDARISGEMVNQLVCGTLMSMGSDVICLGLASTPTVEMAVTAENADGGIILTASHNPGEWNALKLLNSRGEFLSAHDGEWLLKLADAGEFYFAPVEALGYMNLTHDYNRHHIEKILRLPAVNLEAIRAASFRIAVDAVNSVGGIIVPELLNALGVSEVVKLFCEPTGHFPHNPEPLPEHLGSLAEKVTSHHCHLGFVVDPDVDRLAIVDELGNFFGEEYTLVAVSDYILGKKKGNTVSNLSSSRALKDITEQHGGKYFPAAVGEVNVVEMMKSCGAVIGGEGNGGVIYPDLHYGRDALAGIALFLSHLAELKLSCSALRGRYPNYVISKNKIQLNSQITPEEVISKLKSTYAHMHPNDTDGLRIDFPGSWVHMRKSNTEPIIRIYAEAATATEADTLAVKFVKEIQTLMSN